MASCESVSDAESGETTLYGGGVEASPFLGDVAGQFMGVGRHVATPFTKGPEVGLIGPAGVLRMRLAARSSQLLTAPKLVIPIDQ